MLERQVKNIPEEGTNIFLDSSISGHLKTLVQRTNAHIDQINDAATTKIRLKKEVSETISTLLDFAYTTRTMLRTKLMMVNNNGNSSQKWKKY